jgi:hypothetical protein
LKEKYPDLYEDAKKYEKPNKVNGNVFYWSGDESLEEIERPERMEEIKRNWEKTIDQRRKNSSKLVHILTDLEDENEEREGCLICQL